MSNVYVVTENCPEGSLSPVEYVGRFIGVYASYAVAFAECQAKLIELHTKLYRDCEVEIDIVERETDSGITYMRIVSYEDGYEFICMELKEHEPCF